jgi:hypothetical protein
MASYKFAQACRDNCWIKDHLPGHVAQTAATRAFNALRQYAFGKRGRPRFKRRDMYDPIEGKEVKSTIICETVACGSPAWSLRQSSIRPTHGRARP